MLSSDFVATGRALADPHPVPGLRSGRLGWAPRLPLENGVAWRFFSRVSPSISLKGAISSGQLMVCNVAHLHPDRNPIRDTANQLRNTQVWSNVMQQPHLIGHADMVEVRTVTSAAACNQLLADGWVLLGVYPLTTVAEMTSGGARENGEQRKCQDTQRYVRRLVGYVVARRRECACLTKEPF
jgi:hypothetical protein